MPLGVIPRAYCGGRPLAAIKGESKTNILNAAEALFAEKGYEATTTREIAVRSGGTLGTLSYHFGSKQRLLEEIFSRRFSVVAEFRKKYYQDAKVEGESGVPSLEGIVRAITLPYLDLLLSGEPGWRNYIILLGRMRETGNGEQQDLYLRVAEPTMRVCISWLAEVAPDADPISHVYSYEFASMLSILSCSDIARSRVAQLVGDERSAHDGFRQHLLTFALNGVRSTLQLGRLT